jgi:hypothetical protein
MNTENSKTSSNGELMWSMLSELPVLTHHDELDVDFVCWNGIIMNVEHALLVTSFFMLKLHPTPEMIHNANKSFIELYNIGAFDLFGSVNWDGIICRLKENKHKRGLFNYYVKQIEPIANRLRMVDEFELFNLLNLIPKFNS